MEIFFIILNSFDLKEERQAAVEAILNMGHIPAGMELFAAGDEEQFEIIKRWIDRSDIYLLILAGRYGSIEQKSQKSYTHLEYEYALSMKKPFFAIVANKISIDNKVKAIGYDDALERYNPQKLEEFKTLVKSKIVGFYDDCKDIKLEVVKSIKDLSERHKFTGWVSGKIMDEYEKVKTEFEELRSKFINLNEDIKNKEKLKVNELQISTSGSYVESDSIDTEYLQIEVINENSELIDNADILLIAPNNTYLEGKTNADGICKLKKQVGKTYTIYVAHPEYCAFFIDKYEPFKDLIITMAWVENHGSVIFPNSQGYIKGLRGLLKPILDTQYRMYLYADNISINNGKNHPVDFRLGQKLDLEDYLNNKAGIIFLRYIGKSCLIEYIIVPHITWISTGSMMP